jgi:hypothetical protein
MGNGRQVRNADRGSGDPHEREYYTRLRDAWITLAKRCEFFSFSDVTNSGKILSGQASGRRHVEIVCAA